MWLWTTPHYSWRLIPCLKGILRCVIWHVVHVSCPTLRARWQGGQHAQLFTIFYINFFLSTCLLRWLNPRSPTCLCTLVKWTILMLFIFCKGSPTSTRDYSFEIPNTKCNTLVLNNVMQVKVHSLENRWMVLNLIVISISSAILGYKCARCMGEGGRS